MAVSVSLNQVLLQLFQRHALDFRDDLAKKTIKFVRHKTVVFGGVIAEYGQDLFVRLAHLSPLLQFGGLIKSG